MHQILVSKSSYILVFCGLNLARLTSAATEETLAGLVRRAVPGGRPMASQNINYSYTGTRVNEILDAK